MKTTHNEIEISYNEGKNRWDFELRGRTRSAESLAKAKEAIDKEPKKKQVFPRFDAYRFRYSNDVEIITVTSIAENGYSRDAYFWIIQKDGDRQKEAASSLFPVNEKNTAIVAEIKRINTQIEEANKAKDLQQEKLQCATVPKELQ